MSGKPYYQEFKNEAVNAQPQTPPLPKELKRVTDERDIFKKATRTSQSCPTELRLNS